MFNLFPKPTNNPHRSNQHLKSVGGGNMADFLAAGSVSTKDLIAPSYVEVDFNSLKIDENFYRTLYVVGYPRYVSPNWLYSLITFDHPLYISMYIYPTESKNTFLMI